MEMLGAERLIHGHLGGTLFTLRIESTLPPPRTGDTVLLLFGSANRDDHAFPHAGRFDVNRHPERQVAFGRGIHFCLGASLARLEARIALETLLARRRDWDVDLDSAVRLRSGPIRGYSSLPLR